MAVYLLDTNAFSDLMREQLAGDHYGRMKREVEKRGLMLNENDLWIAATALALDAVLITRDSDFQRVPGLLMEDWTQ
jgi:tRNA(fMet)-specific endonuclease VapC